MTKLDKVKLRVYCTASVQSKRGFECRQSEASHTYSKLCCERTRSFAVRAKFQSDVSEVSLRVYSKLRRNHAYSFEYARSEGSSTLNYARSEPSSTLAVKIVQFVYMYAFNIDGAGMQACLPAYVWGT